MHICSNTLFLLSSLSNTLKTPRDKDKSQLKARHSDANFLNYGWKRGSEIWSIFPLFSSFSPGPNDLFMLIKNNNWKHAGTSKNSAQGASSLLSSPKWFPRVNSSVFTSRFFLSTFLPLPFSSVRIWETGWSQLLSGAIFSNDLLSFNAPPANQTLAPQVQVRLWKPQQQVDRGIRKRRRTISTPRGRGGGRRIEGKPSSSLCLIQSSAGQTIIASSFFMPSIF